MNRTLLMSGLLVVAVLMMSVVVGLASTDDMKLTYVGNYSMSNIIDLKVSGNHLYVTSGSNFNVFNINSNGLLSHVYTIENLIGDIAISGDYAYIAGANLTIVDITNPESPSIVGNYMGAGGNPIVVSGDYAYVAKYRNDLLVFDISDKTNPLLIGSCYIRQISDIAVSGNYVYATDLDNLVLINVSDPTLPSVVKSYSLPGAPRTIAFSNNYIYLPSFFYGLVVFDANDPLSAFIAGVNEIPVNAHHIAVSGNYAYIANSPDGASFSQANDVTVINVSNPSAPLYVGNYTKGPSTSGMGTIWDLAVSGDYIYVNDVVDGLVVLHIGATTTAPVHNINKGTDYTTIQTAIDDASPGDEIHVDSGTYYENVVVNKQLILRGIDTGDGMPVVDAGGSGSAIALSTDGIRLERFMATNAGSYPNAGINVISSFNTLRGNTASNNNVFGIYLLSSSNNNIISDSIISNNGNGIFLESSSNNIISGNMVSNNDGQGILLEPSSNNNTISDNTASYNGNHGIVLGSSSKNRLSGNNASNNNGQGILLESSNDNLISNNTALNNVYYGIFLYSSSNNIFHHNNLVENTAENAYDNGNNQWDSGIEGNHYSDYSGIDSNGDGIGDTPYPIPGGSSVDNYPLMNPWGSIPTTGVVHNINKGTDYTTIQAAIDGASLGDEIHVDSGTYYENVVVNKRLTLRGIDTGVGMPVVDAGGSGSAITLSTDGIRLEGFMATNAGSYPNAGINVKSSYNKLSNNIVSNSNYYGIYLAESSNNNIISGNNASNNNGQGIRVSFSNNNTLSSNTVSHNHYGILLDYSSNNTLSSNIVSNSSQFGIYLWSSSNNILSENNATLSKYGAGIFLSSYSNNNILSGNTASNNTYYGIYLNSSSNNIFHHNNFVENTAENAYDNGNNQWDFGIEGNHYSDYPGTDSDGDGIGDTPYPILGGSSVDNYPLMNPWTAAPLSGKIAFASSRNGNLEVYVMNADGDGDPMNLTNLPDADDGDPTWSPDGKQIAFSSNRSGNWKTYVMNADGSNQILLFEDVYNAWGPAWSPDGKKIAVACKINPSDDFEIYTVDINSRALTQVTDNNDPDYHPSWSPDSQKIVFTSDRDSNQEIYVADLLADTQTKLTDEPAYVDYPEWSPDGSMIAFVSERDGNGNLEIFSMDIASKAITRLTYSGSIDKHAQWSPDGQKIIFISDRDGSNMGVYVMGADGTSTTRLVDWDGEETHPTWLPDQSSPSYYVGEGAPDSAIEQLFIDAYNRNGGVGVLGEPESDVHEAFGLYQVQNFPGVLGIHGGVLMYNSIQNNASYIHGAIWKRYYIFPDKAELGPIKEDEKDAAPSQLGTTGRYSKFETGTIHWISDETEEVNKDHPQRGESFVTYGDLDKLYTDMGGTYNNWLGFPVKDQEVRDGHGYCEFEGGYIEWDAVSGAYNAKAKTITPTPSIEQLFIDAYNRNGGVGVLGNPTTEIHSAWGYWVQNFPGASGYRGGIIMYNPNVDVAYYIHGDIWDRYYALGGPVATTDKEFQLGLPTSDVLPYVHVDPPLKSSKGNQYRYQNFSSGTEKAALVQNLNSGNVIEIHGAIYNKWVDVGLADGALGLVTGDEKEAGKSPYGTTGRYSEFENGHIHWVSDLGDDNAGKTYRGNASATYGDLDWYYTNDDGTNGDLGFPVMDKYETTTYGHGECVFEGGKIIWDDYRGLHEIIYHGYLPDLTITDISFSKENPAEGEPITIYATIKNVGYTDAIGEFAVIFYQQSYYENFETDETGSKAYIGRVVGENLGAGESDLITMTWNAAPVFSTNPDGFINIKVDSSEAIEETNEYNNVEWGEVTIISRSNFKPEVDGYHFINFPITDAEIDKMTAEIGIWYDDDFYAALLPKENVDVLLKEFFSKGANCFGMSASSTLFYHQLVPKPDDKDTFDLSKTNEVKQKIYDYQVMQAPYVLDELLRLIYQDIIPFWHHDVEIEYNIIKYHIENDKPIISNINYFYEDKYQIFKPPDGRHALTPFSTYEVSENIKNVLVYDSNHPGMARVVQFDFDNNEITYNDFDGKKIYYGRYSSTKYPLMTMDDAKNTFFDILKEFKKAFIRQLHDSKSKYLMFKCPIDITIIDQYGNIIDNKGNNEIPGAKVNIVGDLKIFLLPADLDYAIKIDAYDSGDFTFTQINPLTSEYASVLSFVDIPLAENTNAIFDINSINPDIIMEIDYDGDGSTDEMKEPDIIDIVGTNFYNITFFPPITTMDQYTLTDGSTLPIKFTARDSTTDEFIHDDTVNVTITNSTGHLITYFTNGTGTDSVRINTEEEQYIVNFHSKNYDLNVGETYAVTVTFGDLDSLRGYDMTYFTLLEGGKAKGKTK